MFEVHWHANKVDPITTLAVVPLMKQTSDSAFVSWTGLLLHSFLWDQTAQAFNLDTCIICWFHSGDIECRNECVQFRHFLFELSRQEVDLLL